jgi:hypothetical protein
MTTFPKAALAQHIAVLGKTGSGKSYAVRGIVESLLDENARVCIIDPTGAWNGLRSSATGKSAGYPVVIFGGEHADLELGYQTGEAMAEIIGTSSTPAILDTSLHKIAARTRFFSDFADALVRKNKGPLHLIIDEAHLFAPQGKVNDPQSGAMLHAANNLVSLGRSRGLRIILITQRPAKLHKDSLTQVETLVAMRLIAPQDRKAVEEWIKDNADEKKGREIIESLATLKTGQGWVWAPEIGVLDRISFPKIKTFDSGRAPDGSETAGQVLAPIDRDAIAARLKVVAAEAVANDPATLKRRIEELERQVKAAPAPDATAIQNAMQAARTEAYTNGHQDGHAVGYKAGQEHITDQLEVFYTSLDSWIANAPRPPVFKIEAAPQVNLVSARKLRDIAVGSTERMIRDLTRKPAPTVQQLEKTWAKVDRIKSNGKDPEMRAVSTAAMKVLAVLSQFPEGCESGKLTLLTGYRYSGGFRNTLGELRGGGFIEGENTGVMRITSHGMRLGPFPQLPVGDELLRYWLNHLSFDKSAREILAALADGRERTKEQLTAATGYEYSGGFRNALGKLRAAGVITGPNTGLMRISREIVP